MTLARLAHRLYAKAHGYFWLPCPVCKEPFGGHEWRRIEGLPADVPTPEAGPMAGVGICPNCTRGGYGYEPGFIP